MSFDYGVCAIPLFVEDIDKGKSIYIYGTGSLGAKTLRGLREVGLSVTGFIDSRQSGQAFGLPVLQLDEYLKQQHSNDLIVLGSSFKNEILHELGKRGYTNNVILPYIVAPAKLLWDKDTQSARTLEVQGLTFLRERSHARKELHLPETDLVHYIGKIIQYCHTANPGSWIIMIPDGVGDNVMHLQLLNSFKAFYQSISGSLTVICFHGQESLLELWRDDVDLAIAIDQEIMISARTKFMTINTVNNIFMPGVPLVPTIRAFPRGLGPGPHGLTMLDAIKITMRLPRDVLSTPPRIREEWRAEAEKTLIENGFAPGRTVILFPVSNTTPPPPRRFWLDLARAFQAAGFGVIWNGPPEMAKECPHSAAFLMPFTHLLPAIEFAGHAVFSRTGVADLCCATWVKGTKSVVYRRASAGSLLMKNDFILKDTSEWSMELQGFEMDHTGYTFIDGTDYSPLIAELVARHIA